MDTLIELFDSCQIENIASFLKFKPQNVIFIGFNDTDSDVTLKVDAIKEIAKEISPSTKINYQGVDRYNYKQITDTLNKIIKNNPNCYFDLTGGKELVLVAMGEVGSHHSVPMYQIDVENNKVIKVNGCENMPQAQNNIISLKQSIILNCGVPVQNVLPNVTDNYMNTVNALWGVAKRLKRSWNKSIVAFMTFQSKLSTTENGLDYTCSVWDFDRKSASFKRLFNLLQDENLITVTKTPNTVKYSYKNKEVLNLVEKSGNILEAYTYIAVKSLQKEMPDIISDSRMQISIKWIDDDNRNLPVANEIDVAFMCGLIPFFVSCKSGKVDKNALYELETVADRLGGKYSRKLLIATDISYSKKSKKALITRAEEMNINVISDVDGINFEKFKEKLKKVISK